jgi:hypothetical protein
LLRPALDRPLLRLATKPPRRQESLKRVEEYQDASYKGGKNPKRLSGATTRPEITSEIVPKAALQMAAFGNFSALDVAHQLFPN